MKKAILSLVMMVVSVASTAKAENNTNELKQPFYECALTFKAQGGGVQLIVGSYKLTGRGTIHCVDIAGNEQNVDVKVTLGGPHIAPNLAIGKFRVAGIASGIGVAAGPEALLGTYYTVGGRAAVIVGAGAAAAVHGGREALTMNLAMSLERGLGIQAGFNKMTIEALN